MQSITIWFLVVSRSHNNSQIPIHTHWPTHISQPFSSHLTWTIHQSHLRYLASSKELWPTNSGPTGAPHHRPLPNWGAHSSKDKIRIYKLSRVCPTEWHSHVILFWEHTEITIWLNSKKHFCYLYYEMPRRTFWSDPNHLISSTITRHAYTSAANHVTPTSCAAAASWALLLLNTTNTNTANNILSNFKLDTFICTNDNKIEGNLHNHEKWHTELYYTLQLFTGMACHLHLPPSSV